MYPVKKLIAIALLLVATTAFADDSYTFEVKNNTDQAIKKILVSEDGEEFGQFNIGKGIAAGASAKLVWDSSTDEESCTQYFKAVFANGEESEAIKFDFCEDELVLEFE
jgi:hypothetical protein